MTIFISGGCKNGKSTIAEDCCAALACGGPLYYIATMQAYDDEDRARIKRHQNSRAGKGFITIEQPRDLLGCLEKSDPENGTYILDSVTALLINEMYSPESFEADKDAGRRTAKALEQFAKSVKNAVFVSDFIYSGAERYSSYTIEYMEALALCDRTLAACCDAVAEISGALATMYKGELPI
ncbi:MAG: bifunctional adenosylcobinamide kinase/adenosylcobinamide-phosphate guanylyltransferase [Firmicutes bacterium]|nr:bifunctional adenosylcobinamide kinase/adenosylcobinamide-phosphate guanylyltransferase [Bacillota bacterium]